jgi:hypothetical protein
MIEGLQQMLAAGEDDSSHGQMLAAETDDTLHDEAHSSFKLHLQPIESDCLGSSR